MKILMINKFLFPNGGSETYIFKLGEELIRQGHEVQYFGMEHEGRCVGNRVNSYTQDMDFHDGSRLKKVTYPIKTIYSVEARRKLRLVLDDFEPDVCHLNNFNYQLTPSIICEIVKWRKKSEHACKIVYTAHDYQLVCPNHMCNIPSTHQNCEQCLRGHFYYCLKSKCIHNSFAKSMIGLCEAKFWEFRKVYKYFDKVICCSGFMKTKLDSNRIFREKTIVMHNFVENSGESLEEKVSELPQEYVLYFGRYSQEKGILTLLEACKQLPNIKFVFAGSGEYEKNIEELPNAINVGFISGVELKKIITNAIFAIYPSEWYENCPFSVMEALSYGIPVIGSKIGGIPELIEDNVNGILFDAHNSEQLSLAIQDLYNNKDKLEILRNGACATRFVSLAEYTKRLIDNVY